MQTIKYKRISGERFTSFKEMYDVTASRSIAPCWQGRSLSEEQYDYAGDDIVYFEDSRKDILEGSSRFDKEYAKVVGNVQAQKVTAMATVRRPSTVRGVVGQSVNVARALSGHPMAFQRREPQPRRTRHVEVFMSLSCPGGTSSQTRLQDGVLVMALVEYLEKCRYGVGLTLFATCSSSPRSGSTIHLAEVPLKSFSSPLNARKAQYPLAASATLFHLGKYWLHRYPETEYLSGEGCAADTTGRAGEVKEYCMTKGGIYISHPIMTRIGARDSKDGFANLVRYAEKEMEAIKC